MQPGPHEAVVGYHTPQVKAAPWMMRAPAPRLWLRRDPHLPATDRMYRLMTPTPSAVLPGQTRGGGVWRRANTSLEGGLRSPP